MSWKGERQRHSMSAHGVRSTIKKYGWKELLPDIIIPMVDRLPKKLISIDELIDKLKEKTPIYNPHIDGGTIQMGLNNDAEIFVLFQELEKNGAKVMVDESDIYNTFMWRDGKQSYESIAVDTIYITFGPKNKHTQMVIVNKMNPDEFHGVMQTNMFRLRWG